MPGRTLVVGAALLLGCLDVSAPRGVRRVGLALTPTYAMSEPNAGAPSDVDSFVIYLTRPVVDTLYIVVPQGQDEIEVSVSVTVSAGEDTVALTFEGYSSVTGLRLYTGDIQVVLVAGLTSVARDVPVTYVGPGGGIGAITIAPTAATLAPGGTVQLAFTAMDTLDAPLDEDSVPVTFISRDPAVADVSAGGLVTAGRDGATFVLVRSVARSSIRDSARVTVQSVAPAAIDLSPASVAVSDTTGTSNPADRTVNVTNSGGGSLGGLAIGTITYGPGASGWLTATLAASTAPTTITLQFSNAGLSAGTYTATVPVTAAGVGNSPQNISVTYTLAPGATLTSLQVTPGFAVLRPGDTQTLVSTARDQAGNPMPGVVITYTSRATGVATVNSLTGQVTAVAGGTAVIVAQASATVADSLVVAVAANGTAVVAAVSNGRFFDVVRMGSSDTARVLVAAYLAGVAPELLGSYNAQFNWAATRLTYAAGAEVPGGFTGTVVNTTSVGTGELRFGAAVATGHAGPIVGLYNVKLVPAGAGAGSLLLSITDLSAAQTFTDLLPAALVVTGVVRVQ